MHANPATAWTGLLVALAVALGGLPPDARAQGRVSRSALIVGVSTYAAPEVPRLSGVPFDIDSARAIARAMDIPETHTTVLRDAQATKAGILDALDRLAAGAAEGSRVLVYFSGHGTRWYEPALQGCKEGLLAYDREVITNEEIARRTRRISALADKMVVLFDACHSDGVTSHRSAPRSVVVGGLTPKFHLKDGADRQACARASNVKTRALVAEATRLGALRENFVQITSSRADEVSFDEAGRGGIATQAVRDCLLGAATDIDASGAVSVGEIEQCAQAIVDRKLRPYADLSPHHVTVAGNRNFVPVTVSRLPASLPALVPTAGAAVAPLPPQAQATVPALPAPAVLAAPAASAPEPALASVATLRDIDAQRTPRRQVDVTVNRAPLKIGRDTLELTVTSSHDGYLYLVLLGSDRRSFYLLFPNGLDRDNAIKARQPLALPRPAWAIAARGPAGTDHLLVLVSDTPRNLAALAAAPPDPAVPFTYALADLPGRRALVDLFAGGGVTGGSGNFGSRLLAIDEID